MLSGPVQSSNGIIYLFREGRHATADGTMLELNQVFCDTRSEEVCIIVIAIKHVAFYTEHTNYTHIWHALPALYKTVMH